MWKPEKRHEEGQRREMKDGCLASLPPLLASMRHPLRLIVNSPFVGKVPFCPAGLSCVLLLESKNILTHLVSHSSVLTAPKPG